LNAQPAGEVNFRIDVLLAALVAASNAGASGFVRVVVCGGGGQMVFSSLGWWA